MKWIKLFENFNEVEGALSSVEKIDLFKNKI